MDFTLTRPDVFPDGTSVELRLASSQPNGVDQPFGSPIATQTVASSAVTFTGLTSGLIYIASGQVGGQWRQVNFTVDDPGLGDVAVGGALQGTMPEPQLADEITGDHGFTGHLSGQVPVAARDFATKEYADELPFGGDGSIFVRRDRSPVNLLDHGDGTTTDWGTIINGLLADGYRHFVFPDPSTDGTGMDYPFSTQIDLTGKASVVFEGPGGRVDHYGNVIGLKKMPARLVWSGTGTTAPIKCHSTIGFTARGLGIYYSSGSFTGTLLDCEDNCAQAMFDGCDIGSWDNSHTTALTLFSFNDSWNCTVQNCNLRGAQWAVIGNRTGPGFSDSIRLLNNYFAACSIAYIGAIGPQWNIDGNTFGMGNTNPLPGWTTPRVIDLPASVTPNLTSSFNFINNTVLDDPLTTGVPWFRQPAINTWKSVLFEGNRIERYSDGGLFDLQGSGDIQIVNNNLGTMLDGGFIADLGDTGAGAEVKSFTFTGNTFTITTSKTDPPILNLSGHEYVDLDTPDQYAPNLKSLPDAERLAWPIDAAQTRPTIAAETALGSGATVGIRGTDIAGFVWLNPGSGATAGKQATITLGMPTSKPAFPGGPGPSPALHVTLTPIHGLAAAFGSPDVANLQLYAAGGAASDLTEWTIYAKAAFTGAVGFAYRVLVV